MRSCESAKRAWYTASDDWYWASHASYSYSSTTTYDTVWLGNYTGPLSTFCDGVPRASGPAPTTTTLGQIYVNSIPPAFPSPSPTCTFDYRGCELVVESYRSWYATSHPATVDPPLPPLCEWGPNECIIPAGEQHCRLDAGEVKLIFWPQSKDPSQLCASNGVPKTPAPTPTTPVIAISDNYTFTSPSVYLSFKQLQGLPCYKTWHSAIVPVPSTAISSLVFGQTSPIERTTSVNWADMNSPVPLSAYQAQQSCWDNWLGVRGTAAGGDGCSTVYDDYLPWLALPTEPAYFTAVDPLFANCSDLFWRKYVFDPPYYLTPVGELLPPSLTAAKTSTTDGVSAQQQQQPSATLTVPVKTTTIAPLRSGAAGPIATVGTQTVSADPRHPHNVVIGGATMVPGQVSAIGTTPIVVRTGAVVIGDQTIALPPPPAAATTARPVATVGGVEIAEDDEGNFVLPGAGAAETLSAGQVTVVKSVTVSVAAGGGALVVGGGSETVTVGGQTGAVLSGGAGGKIVTALEATDGLFVVDGGGAGGEQQKTISVGGPAVTVDGVTVSAAGGGEVVAVVDGSTSTVKASSLARSSSSRKSSGALDATTSVPGLGWASDGPTTAAAASSTKSGAAAVAGSRCWTTVLGLALVVAGLR
ncbi:hypothetical protein SLS55_004619 [Diplodia seriata]|uniref:Uncharacterized protein n=1 Tax=Diplodia seriata TaxID=420778 RepID=A0ABR3CJW9_9PEZI